jgi:protein-tyrosine phosphatase
VNTDAPIKNVRVERDQNGFLSIRWDLNDPNQSVSIYSGDSPDHIDYRHPIGTVAGKEEFTFPDDRPDIRRYFSVMTGTNQEIVTAERLVRLDGTLNFRDLGGYRAGSGKFVKWGMVFRSDALTKLTARDHRRLARMELKAVFDFRGSAEVEQSPDRLPEDGSIAFFHLPVTSHAIDTVSALKRLKKGDAAWLTESFMREGYITNIDQYARTWGRIANYLAMPEYRPLVFHCTAGKDRTGTFAALLLLLLGVPEETIIRDHGLSNFFLQDFLEAAFAYFEEIGVERETIAPYLTAPQDAMIALLEHVRNRYGSAETYFLQEAGLLPGTIDCLRRDLLE